MHSCSTLVISCIDYRFQDVIHKFLNKNVPGDYDLVSVVGACKSLIKKGEREFLIKQIGISSKLHKIKRVYLINHQDCGAYGNEDFLDPISEKKRHFKDLKKAKETLYKIFPNVENIKLFFLNYPDSNAKKAVVEQIR